MNEQPDYEHKCYTCKKKVKWVLLERSKPMYLGKCDCAIDWELRPTWELKLIR